MIRLTVAALALRVLVLFANPPKGELVSCPHCGAKNEPSNTRCVTCHQPI